MSETQLRPRNLVVDLLRVVGAVGIIVFHMNGPLAWLGYAALPFFIALSVALTTRPERAAERARKLIVLWLSWCVIYAGLKGLQALVVGKPISSEFEAWMIWTGPGIHLWFLPFIAVAILAVGGVSAKLRPQVLASVSLICLGVTLAALSFLAVPKAPPLAQWVFGLPAVFAGAVILGAQGASIRWPALAALAMLAAGWALGGLPGGLQHTLGTAVVLAALWLTNTGLPHGLVHVARLAPLSLGAYLVHPAVIAALGQITHSFDSPNSYGTTSIVIFLSYGIAWAGSRIRLTRPVFVV